MIEKLQNSSVSVAQEIRSVFQVSYKVEAKLLNAIDFPPLQRPLEKFVKSNTEFYGYSKSGKVVGVIEIDNNNEFTLIRSLVVDPHFFRQGIAKRLMEFVLNKYESDLIVVETGLDNSPAIKLYEKLDFVEVKQWDTDHGVRKIKFEREAKN